MKAEKDLTWYNKTAPEPGDNDCLCSYCNEKITEDDFPIRLWKERDPDQMAIIHEKCFVELHNRKIFTSVKYGE